MSVLRQHEGSAAKALMFAILTAGRAGEVLGAVWDELSLDPANPVWTIPASRMKSRREHRVPLSPQVIELLNGLPREPNNPYLFIGSKSGAGLSETSLAAVLRRAGRTETVHGIRSSFSDFCHERTNFSNHVIESSLAHQIGSSVERAYRRGDMLDQRRRLMETWARYATTPLAASAVVPLRRSR
jgi:integrase